jgi:large subunit ribosomal protein L25
MAQERFSLAVTKRVAMGRQPIKQVRHQGMVPAVVYGRNQESISLMVSERVLAKAMAQVAFHTHVVDLLIDDKKLMVLLKCVQTHPVSGRVLHLDFHVVSAKDMITRAIPLDFQGEQEAPGLREGGHMEHFLTEIEVKCLPHDLPTSIVVDVSKMGLNETVHLSDVLLPEKVTLVADISGDHDHPVVSLHQMRVQVEEPEAPVSEEDAEATDEEGADEAGSDTKSETKGETKDAQ